MQHFQQQARQGSEMKSRFVLPLHLCQRDLRARDGGQHRNGRWSGSRFLRQARVKTFHLLVLFFQAARDPELDHRLDSRRQRQQICQARELIVFTNKDRINADGLRLEPVIVSLAAPVATVMHDTSLERDDRRSIGQLHAPAQSLTFGGDRLLMTCDLGDLATMLNNFLLFARGRWAPTHSVTVLDFLLDTPFDLQQSFNAVLPEFRIDGRFQAGFITELAATLLRLGSQSEQFSFSQLQLRGSSALNCRAACASERKT